jgi:hypothetical protein
MLNQAFRYAVEGQDEFIRLMMAQHKHTRDMISDWLERKPWEYGSLDSVDYMDAALALSDEFIDRMQDERFLEGLDHDYLMANFACDGVCNELWEKYPDPEDNDE